MPVPNPTTVDELVATLQRSQLPTVIVEGKDDMHIYRWIEERVGARKVDVHSAGDRNKLLAVYQRRNEYAHLPVAFVADRDMWLFSGIPPEILSNVVDGSERIREDYAAVLSSPS